MTVVHNDTHICEQFLNLHAGLGLYFVFVFLFGFTIYAFLCKLRSVFPGLLAFVVMGLVSSVTKPRDV